MNTKQRMELELQLDEMKEEELKHLRSVKRQIRFITILLLVVAGAVAVLAWERVNLGEESLDNAAKTSEFRLA